MKNDTSIGALPQSQKGYMMITWVMILSASILVGMIGLRLFPPFMEGYLIKQSLIKLSEDTKIKEMSGGQIRKALQKKFYFSNIKLADANELVVKKENGTITLSFDCEIRVHAIGNIDAVIQFSDSILVQ